MPENMIEAPVLTSLVAVEFGSRVAVIGDERRIEAVIAAGKPVTVTAFDGQVKVTPGERWVKRNGATRFELKGETGHGPRGGRKRYDQTIAAFYVEGVEPVEFVDGATLLTAEADSHDSAASKVTGKAKGNASKGNGASATASSPDIDALVAAAVAAALTSAGYGEPSPALVEAATRNVTAEHVPTTTVTRKPKVSSQRRKPTSRHSAANAEALLGL